MRGTQTQVQVAMEAAATLARDLRDPRAHAQGHRADQGPRVLSGRVAPSVVRSRSKSIFGRNK